MNKQTQIGVAALVLAGLGAVVWKQKQADESVGKTTATAAALPDIKGPEDVDKVVLTNGDKGEIVLEKKGDKWELVKPVAYAANQQSVKSLVDNFKELKATEVIANKVDDEMKKLYEFEPSKAVHIVAFKGGEKKVDLTFGKSGGRGQMVMVDGKPGVYAATGYSSYLYTKELKQWRDAEIFKFEDANATQVSITNKNGVFSFTKGDKWGGTFKEKAIERFDESKVNDAVRAYKGLLADDFADGKTAAETGLDAPEATVTVSLKDNAGKYTLKIGKVATGTSRYAQKEGSPTIFVVSSWPSEWALAEVSKFQTVISDGGKDAASKPALEMPDLSNMGMPPGHPGHGH
jgi:hypothetical protein